MTAQFGQNTSDEQGGDLGSEIEYDIVLLWAKGRVTVGSIKVCISYCVLLFAISRDDVALCCVLQMRRPLVA